MLSFTSTIERSRSMAGPYQSDRAILDEIRALADHLRDDRAKVIIQNVVDAVALNPQPLPPEPPPPQGAR
jgi:hypothetical protein